MKLDIHPARIQEDEHSPKGLNKQSERMQNKPECVAAIHPRTRN
jgi:hypothetical protein